MPDITNLNGASFNELQSSLLLSTGFDGGVTLNADGTYTIAPNGIGLANYDQWNGTLAAPAEGDTLSVNTFIPGSATPDVLEYTLTESDGVGGSTISPSTGGIGAEVIAWNSTGVLLEQLNGYVPGTTPVIDPDGSYFVLSTLDLSVNDGSEASLTPAELTFGTTAPFPTLCFLPGTAIATPSGETSVERLAVGDMVLTASGAARPVVWIGTGKVLTQRGHRTAATPIILRKGALAPNVPDRDLRVTKGHSFQFDDVLIPAEFLVNHRSILWDDHAPQEVTLFHIELETHDVLLANGAPAESYRDDGNRWLFRNANGGWDQPAKPPVLPVLTGGEVVDAVWRRLLDRAGPRPGIALTDQTDLHLSVNDVRIDAHQVTGDAWVFRLPTASSIAAWRIVSRAAAPDELGLARDPRLLGVALRQIIVRTGKRSCIIDADDQRLAEGFHAYETGCGFRWTDGDAALPLDLLDGFRAGAELVLLIGGTTKYIADGRCHAAA